MNSLAVHFQCADKGLLRNIHTTELAHLLLTRLLLIQQLAFARGVAAVAFGRHVFAQGRQGFAGDDFAADGRLDRDFEHVAGDQLF
jgi:hypothetical protein